MITENDYVPMALWGKDHWSTLAYIETRLADEGPYKVQFDPRMRQKRRHWRELLEEETPQRQAILAQTGLVMSREHGTRLADGDVLQWHDDWDCVLDMVHAGFFECTTEEFYAGLELTFSQLGQTMASELRRHKATGGTFSTFLKAKVAA